MPGNRIKTMKALQSRKGSITGSKLHPNSRRAKQLQRIELRSKKLDVAAKVQRSGEVRKVDRHLYFVHALSLEVASINLIELHEILINYINRNQNEMNSLKSEREERSWRKLEGKTKREIELDNLKESDESEYRSGFVIPDLTLPTNVFLCRQWTNPLPTLKDPKGTKGGDPSFLGRIRMIRIFSEDKTSFVVETEGAREGEWELEAGEGEGEDGMEEDDDEEDGEEEEGDEEE